MKNGNMSKIDIFVEKGGILRLKNPFNKAKFTCSAPYVLESEIIVIRTKEGQKISIK